MFDFPNSPTNGQVFAPTGGPVYVYTGGVWRMQGSGQVVTAETRNRIVNGAMQISQENPLTAVTVAGSFPVDQWIVQHVTSGTITSIQVASTTPLGSRFRLRTTVTVADAALAVGDQLQIITKLEGIKVSDYLWGTASAKQFILRFGFRAPAGTYSVFFRNDVPNRSYLANFTISAAQANTDTDQVFVIPGDTLGTWLVGTSVGIQLGLCYATGTTTQGAAGWQAGNFIGTAANTNGMATAGAVFELFDVGLYLDPNATGVPPPWQMPDEAQELAACQRYYYAPIPNQSAAFFVAASAQTSDFAYMVPFPVQMRVAPTVGGPGHTYSNCSAGAFVTDNMQTTLRVNVTAAGNYRAQLTVNLPINARM